MNDVFLIDALRTPIGALGGALAAMRPDDLAAHVLRQLIERVGLEPAAVDEVYLGCANRAGEDNRNVARMAALLAGFPVSVAGLTSTGCAHRVSAVNQAARAIRAGEGDLIIAGGVESMSRAPYSLPKAEAPYAFGNLTAWDTALGWRYPNPRMVELYGTDLMGRPPKISPWKWASRGLSRTPMRLKATAGLLRRRIAVDLTRRLFPFPSRKRRAIL